MVWKKDLKDRYKIVRRLTEREIQEQLYGHCQDDLLLGPSLDDRVPAEDNSIGPKTLDKVPRKGSIFKYQAQIGIFKRSFFWVIGIVFAVSLSAATFYFSKTLIAKASPIPAINTIPIKKPYTIQVAIYANLKDANSLVAALNSKGYKAFVFKSISSKGKTHYRIYVDQFSDIQQAQPVLERLKDGEKFEDAFVRFH